MVCTSGRLCDVIQFTYDAPSKDEKKHDAVDKSTSKQQVHVSDGSRFPCAKAGPYT